MDNDNFRASKKSKAKQAACRTHKLPHTLIRMVCRDKRRREEVVDEDEDEDEDENARDESTEEERTSPRMIC